jgi:hypothetical protein
MSNQSLYQHMPSFLHSICTSIQFNNICRPYLPSIRPTNHFTIIRHLYLLSICPANLRHLYLPSIRPTNYFTITCQLYMLFYKSCQSSTIFICFPYVLPIVRLLSLLSICPTNQSTNIRHLYLPSIRLTNHFTIIRIFICFLYILPIVRHIYPLSICPTIVSHVYLLSIWPTNHPTSSHVTDAILFFLFPATPKSWDTETFSISRQTPSCDTSAPIGN